jgi:hypothetical protein
MSTLNLTYYVRMSQRGREDQWGVFEQMSGSDGWYLEIKTCDTELEALLAAETYRENVAAAVAAQRLAEANESDLLEYCPYCNGSGMEAC